MEADKNALGLLEKLADTHSLTEEEYRRLISGADASLSERAASMADRTRRSVYGNTVYLRGLIEISSYCRNDCLYCGLRRSNRGCERYRLDAAQILGCCDEGYKLGLRTFVMQGGEDAFYTDERLCALIAVIKERYPDCAVTLSLGERSRDSYRALKDAGADRYLLRHETADPLHYARLHPPEMSRDNRMRCLYTLRGLGFQTGCGFMVGSPFQTEENIARDLKFIELFMPDMCGIGPFIPHHATPFAGYPAGSLSLTLLLLSIVRLMLPGVLLPATTALGTIDPRGRELGLLAGANVIMPNLSPPEDRSKYELYNGKLSSGAESAQNLAELDRRVRQTGYEIVTARGDAIHI